MGIISSAHSKARRHFAADGTVHSDFQRGFIRAEVTPYDDLVRCGGIPQCRKEGVLRSEGKTYQVKDGDVINFLIST